MERFTNAVIKSLATENWYSALSLALTLPDICGKVEQPEAGSQARYVSWFNRYILEKYTGYIGPDREEHKFLLAEDCYALRCSYLHEGGGNIEDQRASEALDKFHFIIPPDNGIIRHKNQYVRVLQLQIDIFCNDICDAVNDWMANEVSSKTEYQDRISKLLVIYDRNNNIV